MRKSKQHKARDVRKASRDVIGEPSRNRKRGPHKTKRKPAPQPKDWQWQETEHPNVEE